MNAKGHTHHSEHRVHRAFKIFFPADIVSHIVSTFAPYTSAMHFSVGQMAILKVKSLQEKI